MSSACASWESRWTMAQSKEFVDASHALNDLSHALALLESENASLRGAVDGLCNDNAKLREELADAPKCETCEAMLDCDECLRADVSHKERRRLSAENAKLRELVRDVWHLFTEHGAVNPCDLPVVDAVRDRMRELGVEVTS